MSEPVSEGLPARTAAARLLWGVIEKRKILPAAGEVQAPPAARALARALASTGLRHWGQINLALAQLLARPEAKTGRALARIRYPLAIAAAEILFLNRPAHAAVFLAVEQIRRDQPSLTGLANALARRLAAERERLRALPVAANMPGWMAGRWQAQWGAARTARLAEIHSLPPARPVIHLKDPETLALWARKLNAQPLFCGTMGLPQLQLRQSGAVEKLPGYREGVWWVQSMAAAFPARLLGAVRNLDVLDLCAAPGGKAAQLASAGARLTAFEPAAARRRQLRQNFRRLRLTALFPEKHALLAKIAPGGFDAVLVDAPCTGTGTLRRNPDLAYVRRESDLPRLLHVQKNLLAGAAGLLKPGGLLVYSVCSLEREEGEAQIASFLAAQKDFILSPVKAAELGGRRDWLQDGQCRIWPAVAREARHKEMASEACPDITAREARHKEMASEACHQGEQGSMDGFYAARLRRR